MWTLELIKRLKAYANDDRYVVKCKEHRVFEIDIAQEEGYDVATSCIYYVDEDHVVDEVITFEDYNIDDFQVYLKIPVNWQENDPVNSKMEIPEDLEYLRSKLERIPNNLKDLPIYFWDDDHGETEWIKIDPDDRLWHSVGNRDKIIRLL